MILGDFEVILTLLGPYSSSQIPLLGREKVTTFIQIVY